MNSSFRGGGGEILHHSNLISPGLWIGLSEMVVGLIFSFMRGSFRREIKINRGVRGRLGARVVK